MSVIVKDMEMPKSCIWRDGRCPLLGDDDGCKLQDCQEEWTWEDQYKGCPLSEAYEGDDPRADVYYLAEEIGIHQLYSLVVALRGEPEPCKDAVNPCTVCQEFDCYGCKFKRTSERESQ